MIERPAIHPIDRLLGPGGALAERFEGYEARESQLEFARDVAAALAAGRVLLAEAPTGVGKSLGYLAPALLWARREREPVVVSTHTKQLQGQLTDVDLPALAAVLDPAPRVVRLKGKSNYVCPRRWRLHVAEHKRAGRRATRAESAVAGWIDATATGELDELDLGALAGGAALRPRIATDPAFCSPAVCRGDCPWRRARRQAAAAEIVVVNHALLVTGLPGNNILPPFRALVIDEAHHLDAVFTAQSTVRQTQARLDTLLGLVHGDRPGQGNLPAVVQAAVRGKLGARHEAGLAEDFARLAGLVEPLREAGRAFYGQLARGLPAAEASGYEPRARFRLAEELVGGEFDPLERLLTLGEEGERRWKSALGALAGATGPAGVTGELEELAGDVGGALGSWQAWLAELRFLTDPRDSEFVYWRGGARADTAELAAAPVEVARRVREGLLPDLSALVLTSATLTAGGSFRYLRERLGLDQEIAFEVAERVYPSPFDFPRQLGAWVLEAPPPAGGGGEAADDGTGAAIEALVRRLGRNTLALFTSHQALRAAARRLRERLGGDVALWAQDVDGSAIELARRFREARGALLLGTASFWEGVDFPGEALEVLVVTRLPFSVPTDPLVEARCERIEQAGESSFARAMLPEAVLRFRQGVGRLVRRQTDRGVLAILDPRIARMGYGAHFRRGLPVALRSARSADDLAAQAERFLAEGT